MENAYLQSEYGPIDNPIEDYEHSNRGRGREQRVHAARTSTPASQPKKSPEHADQKQEHSGSNEGDESNELP